MQWNKNYRSKKPRFKGNKRELKKKPYSVTGDKNEASGLWEGVEKRWRAEKKQRLIGIILPFIDFYRPIFFLQGKQRKRDKVAAKNNQHPTWSHS